MSDHISILPEQNPFGKKSDDEAQAPEQSAPASTQASPNPHGDTSSSILGHARPELGGQQPTRPAPAFGGDYLSMPAPQPQSGKDKKSRKDRKQQAAPLPWDDPAHSQAPPPPWEQKGDGSQDPDAEPDDGKKKKKPKKKRSIYGGLFRVFFFLLVAGLFAGSVGGVALYFWASSDLPSFSRIADYRPPQATVILARDGSLIWEFYRERRYVITMDEMTPYLPLATLAIEDDRFYEHAGVDIRAIMRAMVTNLETGETSQGGSTITQQVVKRLMLTPEKSYIRKLKEAILAYRVENQMSKDQILELYMNLNFYGNNCYGVEAAAREFFGCHANELSLAQAALIAGLPQSPTYYNPYRYPQSAKDRQTLVLRRMRDLAWISESEYEQAINEPLEYQSLTQDIGEGSGWYREEVRRTLVSMFSEENAAANGLDFGVYGEEAVYTLGLVVHTAMDPFQQATANSALRLGLEEATRRHGWLGPLQQLVPSEYDEFLNANPFRLTTLERDGWLKALVVGVEKGGATVRLGPDHQGYVYVKTMAWCRTPNKNAAGSLTHTYVTDATSVLKEGDVIWVSYWPDAPKNNDNPFSMAAITPETVIPLALEQYPDVQGAFVAIEPESCDVVALVGGYEFGYQGSQFNRAVQAARQPGSSFKPIVYSASLDNGFTAASMILDAPIMVVDEVTGQAWRPGNFDGVFDGQMRLNRALARSRNLCTVRVVQQMGIEPVIQRAKDLGLTPDFPPYLAISLGSVEVTPLNMAQAYTAFANLGQVSTPRLITSIEGPYGNIVWDNPPEHRQGISPQNAYVMSSMLRDVVRFGTAARANSLGRPLGGKTGSTNEEIDAWFLSITPYLVTSTYIGHDQVQPMGRGETGSGAALPIFLHYAETAYEQYEPIDFPVPDGIVFSTVDGVSMPFIAGTQPGTGYGINALGGGTPEATEGEEIMRTL